MREIQVKMNGPFAFSLIHSLEVCLVKVKDSHYEKERKREKT